MVVGGRFWGNGKEDFCEEILENVMRFKKMKLFRPQCFLCHPEFISEAAFFIAQIINL